MHHHSKALAPIALVLVAWSAGCAPVGPDARTATASRPVSPTTGCDAPRDAAAIRAMAGSYDVDFDFKETVPLAAGYQPRSPHHSAATELVILLDDTPGHVSLQHVLVVGGDVVKHWRQDWTFEDRDLMEFRGRGVWARRTLTPEATHCSWTQAVSGVEDGPRYEGYGRWSHDARGSVWESNETWRPLPRREYTTRSDYDVLVGVNRHRITPAGWEHEQENAKLVLEPQHFLVREHGLNSYTRTKATETQLAAKYWQSTAPFWKQVRDEWTRVLGAHESLTLQTEADGKRLYEPLFERALAPKRDDAEFIRDTIGRYFTETSQPLAKPAAGQAPLEARERQP